MSKLSPSLALGFVVLLAPSLVHADGQGLASTTSPDEACSRYDQVVETLSRDPHRIALASVAGSLVGAGLATVGTQIETRIAQNQIQQLTQRSYERFLAQRYDDILEPASTLFVRKANELVVKAAQDGSRFGFRVGGKTFPDLARLLTSNEFFRALDTPGHFTQATAVGRVLNDPSVRLDMALRLTGQFRETFESSASLRQDMTSMSRACLKEPSSCFEVLRTRVYPAMGRTPAKHVASSPTLRQSTRAAVARLFGEEGRRIAQEAVARLRPSANIGSCVRSGGRLLRWAGIVSAVATELFWTTPANAATLDQAFSEDPSLLLDETYRGSACARLRANPELREKFVLMADLTDAAEQRTAYAGDLVCGGPNDRAARDHRVSELVATGEYRAATPDDFRGNANTLEIRQVLADQVGVVPAQ